MDVPQFVFFPSFIEKLLTYTTVKVSGIKRDGLIYIYRDVITAVVWLTSIISYGYNERKKTLLVVRSARIYS